MVEYLLVARRLSRFSRNLCTKSLRCRSEPTTWLTAGSASQFILPGRSSVSDRFSVAAKRRHENGTRGQWPYRPAATRAMRNRHAMLYDIKRPWRSFDVRFEISNLYYPGIHVHIASNGLLGHGCLQTNSEVHYPCLSGL